MNVAQIPDRDLVHRKPADQRTPLCGHVRDRKPRVHGERRHSGPRELDRRIQAFIVVIKPAQRNDDVLASDTVRQLAFEHDLNRPRNLPPEFARSPNRGCIRTDNRRSNGAQRAVHIGMRIRCHRERTRNHIPALHHDLVPNARSGRIKIYTLLLRKRFNRAVLLEVRFFLILDVMIERERKLLRIFHLLRADALELAHHC